MKNFTLLLVFVGLIGFSQSTTKQISGLITDGRSPIANVGISIEGSSTNIFSNDQGRYSIEANVGDNIKYAYQGLKTVVIKVEDVTRILNITMVPDVQALDEVTVIGSNRKSQSELALEYPTNSRLIRTAFGYLNADTAPGNIRFLSEEEINPVAICILDLLRNQFAGVKVQGSCLGAFGPGSAAGQLTNIVGGSANETGVVGLVNENNGGINSSLNTGKVFIRGNSSLFNPRSAIFDVDGQIFNDPPIWLDVKNIKRLAILNNFATAVQYGSAGAGGVIVINTITASPKSDTIFDQARLRNNFVANNIRTQQDVQRNWPSYLEDIYNSSSFEQATQVYDKYASQYASLPYFTLDMQKYFSQRWNEKGYADNIVESNRYLFDGNAVLLKALAYQYQEQGEANKANAAYKQVMKLRPNYAQSYLDLANSYRELGDTQQAAAIYTRYSYLIDEGLLEADSIGVGPIMEREYNNFLLLDKNRLVKGSNAESLYVAEEDIKGTRLVFEWNDSEAEFELQFVNPKKQYFLLKHSLADNSAMIAREKDFGFNTAEYFLDGSLPGLWTVNVNYLGNKSLTPTYLKATVYYNYGTYAQRKETKVFKLALKNVPYELFDISVGGKLVLR
ncbi:MAG: hypothetical protein KJO73_02830 [Croceitalea sp.]|nr:hypothetical protein [Croceitalea sp.]